MPGARSGSGDCVSECESGLCTVTLDSMIRWCFGTRMPCGHCVARCMQAPPVCLQRRGYKRAAERRGGCQLTMPLRHDRLQRLRRAAVKDASARAGQGQVGYLQCLWHGGPCCARPCCAGPIVPCCAGLRCAGPVMPQAAVLSPILACFGLQQHLQSFSCDTSAGRDLLRPQSEP